MYDQAVIVSGHSEIILNEVLSLTSSSDSSLGQGNGESTDSSTEQATFSINIRSYNSITAM